METIYLFNPSHELALASDNISFTIPKYLIEHEQVMRKNYAKLFDQAGWSPVILLEDIGATYIDWRNTHLIPWAWNWDVRRRALAAGMPELQQKTGKRLIPAEGHLLAWRAIAHRRTAVWLLSKLRQSSIPQLTGNTKECRSIEDILSFHREQGENEVLLKYPYSSSGKGQHLLSRTSHSLLVNYIKKYGCLIAEDYKNEKILDFAMLFHSKGGKIHFVGYSMFCTNGSRYLHNLPMTDAEIEQKVCQYIKREVLNAVRRTLLHLLPTCTIPFAYQGYLGVDMLVCREGGKHKLLPCVEMNLRTTMGVLTHLALSQTPTPP